ncbi:MAG: 30S ribosomal protein S1 [Candidatus Omnitrophica bacterium]|nr:30S ribosomal protein S1 [Candidatus Omnitrophota bacterium]
MSENGVDKTEEQQEAQQPEEQKQEVDQQEQQQKQEHPEQQDEQQEEGQQEPEEMNFEEAYYQSMKTLKEGEIIKGKIVGMTKRDVVVDVGYKSEGLIPQSEFPEPAELKVGDEIEVLLESKEDEDGMVVLSKKKADKIVGWERIIGNYGEGDTIKGKASRKVKGGLMVNIGVEAFLPASQSSLRGAINLNSLMGQELDYKIIKINKFRKNIVVSRREVLAQEREDSKIKLLEELKKDDIKKGTVKNITDFGAFINLGGLDGLLHITDMSWGRISHPSEVLAVGDEVEVKILDIDKEHSKVSLGLKQKTPSPWGEVEAKYPVGSKIKGKVVNIMPYGAFIELEKGVEGLIHISEMSWTKRINHPSEVLAIGDIVEAVVLTIDKDSQKISLGLKQLEANPWLEAMVKYPVGSKVKGKIKNLTDYGAFVELDENIDGLIHISDISWTRRLSHPSEVLKKGQKVEAVVLSVDQDNTKIALGYKQLQDDPWPQYIEKYTIDTVVEGPITKIINFGLFVEINKDLEGLVHISELTQPAPANLEEKYKVGDKIKAKIIKIDNENRKIGLSMKGAGEEVEAAPEEPEVPPEDKLD